MLGFIGKWAGSKGMGRIPNLIGLNKQQAREALQNAGFIYGIENEEVQSDESLSNKVKSQGKQYNDLVDYETSVDYIIHTFSFTPFSVFGFSPTPPESFTVFGFSPTPPVSCGDCEEYIYTVPTCNGEDSYEGIFRKTRKECPPGSGNWVDCTSAEFQGYGACIATNVSSCGGSGGAGGSCAPAFNVFGFSPTPPVSCGSCGDGGFEGGEYSQFRCSGTDYQQKFWIQDKDACGNFCGSKLDYWVTIEQNSATCGGTPFTVFGFSPTPPESFTVFGFSPTIPDSFTVFGFSPTPPEPFTVFGFSPTPPESFTVFGFSPTPACPPSPTCGNDPCGECLYVSGDCVGC